MLKNPFLSHRAPFYDNVSEEKWTDWRWQLSNRLNTVEDFEKVLSLTEGEQKALKTKERFRVDVTPYFVSLIDPDNPIDPIRKQVIPTEEELMPFTGMMEDSLAEDKQSPVPGLVHRYPDRALLLVTTQCATYCRYCTRSRIVGDPSATFSKEEFEQQVDYLKRTPQIRDVLVSGGDPFTLAPKQLELVLSTLRDIPHIEVIRIGVRSPVFLPMRVTDELCDMLQKYHPLWVNISVNHPNEITAELASACDKLSRAGIPLGNQSVLMAGVNDCVHIQRRLVHNLLQIRVRPYYLYQADMVQGGGHFRTSVGKGIEIIEGLRGHTSGFAVPTYIIDAPGGGGKISAAPNYVVSASDHKVIIRTFEGFLTTYEEPIDYRDHDSSTCRFCQEKRSETGQRGLTGLLEGDELCIKPIGWEEVHSRSDETHRIRVDEHKWKPLGIGQCR